MLIKSMKSMKLMKLMQFMKLMMLMLKMMLMLDAVDVKFTKPETPTASSKYSIVPTFFSLFFGVAFSSSSSSGIISLLCHSADGADLPFLFLALNPWSWISLCRIFCSCIAPLLIPLCTCINVFAFPLTAFAFPILPLMTLVLLRLFILAVAVHFPAKYIQRQILKWRAVGWPISG